MAAKGTTKGKTSVHDDTVDEKTQTAENWWYNLSDTEQEQHRGKFKSSYAPTGDEMLAAYEETHGGRGPQSTETSATPKTTMIAPENVKVWWTSLPRIEQDTFRDKFKSAETPTDEELVAAHDEAFNQPPTPERALAWWRGLSMVERQSYRDGFIDIPEEGKLVEIYEVAHKQAAIPEQQHDGSEPPTVQAATPFASATNHELIRNDAVPGENAALYEQSPIPGGYQPPPPPEPLP